MGVSDKLSSTHVGVSGAPPLFNVDVLIGGIDNDYSNALRLYHSASEKHPIPLLCGNAEGDHLFLIPLSLWVSSLHGHDLSPGTKEGKHSRTEIIGDTAWEGEEWHHKLSHQSLFLVNSFSSVTSRRNYPDHTVMI